MDTPTGFKSKWRLASGVLSYMSDTLRRQSGVQATDQKVTQQFDTRAADALLGSAQLGVIALEIDMDIQEASDPQVDVEREWSSIFDDVLTTANDLIDDKILENREAGVQTREAGLDDASEFPKLYALLDSQLQNTQSSSGAQNDNAAGWSDWVMVPKDTGRSKLLKEAHKLYEGVTDAFSHSIGRAELEIQKQDLTDEVDNDKLLQAEAISQSVEDLYRQMDEGLRSCFCQSDHLCQSKLYLSDFSQIRLDLMLDASGIWCSAICTDQRCRGLKLQSDKIEQLCQTLQTTCALNESVHFTFGNDSLCKVPFKDTEKLDLSSKSPSHGTSLHALMNQRSNWDKLERADKRKLMATIACSLLVLYGSSWWKSSELLDYVRFSHDTASTIPDYLSPHILQSFEDAKSPERQSDAMIHRHPVFLQYGMLLMEFEYGKKLEADPGPQFGEPAELYLVLKGHLEDSRIRRSVSDACRQIGKACLYFDEHLAAFDQLQPRNDCNLKFRAVIYKLILKPLLQEIRKDFPGESLNGLDLPNWSDGTGAHLAHIPRRNGKKSTIPEHGINRMTRPMPRRPFHNAHVPRRPSILHHYSSAPDTEAYPGKPELSYDSLSPESDLLIRSEPQGLVFFDELSTDNQHDILSARKFFALHKTFFSKKIRRQKSQSRVRVAILDTGLNHNIVVDNPVLQGILRYEKLGDPIIEMESFTDSTVDDEHGHGTHTAALFLKIAPHAELFIAKIANNDALDNQGLESVCRALKWAMKKKVDIVSMSFGFPERCYNYDELASCIQDAYAQGIVLLAAASNEGANGPRSYPANDRHVICIHAFDGMGKDARSFNPQAVPNEDNFATLGIGVECIWKGVTCYKSGTSFATPIAAGIAANSLQYAKFHTEEGRLSKQDKIYERLKSVVGMRKMFQLMADHTDKYQWVRPWGFWKPEDNDQDHCRDLERGLRDVTLFSRAEHVQV